MDTQKIYFKSDFALFLTNEVGWGTAPFELTFFTNSPRLGYRVSYDGTNWHGCKLLSDGRLQVNVDNHHLGVGVLMIEQRYYLTNADYADGVEDIHVSPRPLINVDDDEEESNIVLSLAGAKTLSVTSQIPPSYQKFTFDELTDEEIEYLRGPSVQAAALATAATTAANTAAGAANSATSAANSATSAAVSAASSANSAAASANLAAQKINYFSSKLENIESSTAIVDANEIVFCKDNGDVVGKVTDGGADFVSLKEGGKNVLTEDDRPAYQNDIEKSSSVGDADEIVVEDEEGNAVVSVKDGVVDVKALTIGGKSPANTKRPLINNPKLDLKKEELRILDIGNSFSKDPLAYIGKLCAADGIDTSDMAIVKMERGSSSFKSWYDCWHDEDDTKYTIKRILGGLCGDYASGISVPVVDGHTSGQAMRDCLTNTKWDLIIIHQAGGRTRYYEHFETRDTFFSDDEQKNDVGYLVELMRIIKAYQPQAVIGYMMEQVSSTNPTDKTKWGESANGLEGKIGCISHMKSVWGVDFVIPSATAIENLRASGLNDWSGGTTFNFCRDSWHLGLGVARYVGACTVYESIISPRYNVSVIGNKFRYTDAQIDEEWSKEGNKKEAQRTSSVAVTDDNALTCQMCAVLACSNMQRIQNPDNVSCELFVNK